ncbi:DUF5819 family protein [Streptomyces sp. NPDC002990]
MAPASTVSQRYRRHIDAWVYPLFEQNWKLFAPHTVGQAALRPQVGPRSGPQKRRPGAASDTCLHQELTQCPTLLI